LNNRSLNLNDSIEWLKAGKVLVHPTESIWGLGCDAFNENALQLIFNIKNRPTSKNFILLAGSYSSIQNYILKPNLEQKKLIETKWPGPYTFLFKYNENIPAHLKTENGKIAFRVSNHLPIKHLFESYKSFMVSTSANFSGKKNINCPNEILKIFNNDNLAYYDELTGLQNKPSQIIDLETNQIIRK